MAEDNVMRGVIPYLVLGGRTGEACDFYARAFGAEEKGRMPFPDGTPGLMHAQVQINGGVLMMTDHGGAPAEATAGTGARVGHLQLVVKDGQGWWDRAVAAGCDVIEPFQKQPWGDLWGMVTDPFGLKWAVLEETAPTG